MIIQLMPPFNSAPNICCLSKSLDMSLNHLQCRDVQTSFPVSEVSGEHFTCFCSKGYTLIVKTDTYNFEKVLRTMGSFEGPRTRGLRAVLGENHADVWACAPFQKQMWNVLKKMLRAMTKKSDSEYKLSKKDAGRKGARIEKVVGSEHRGRSFRHPHLADLESGANLPSVLTRVLEHHLSF